MRFGPFQLLQFQDSASKIVDETGAILVAREGDVWRPTDKLPCTIYGFSDPLISATPNLPRRIRNTGRIHLA